MLTKSRYQARTMAEADISQVVEIERESFPTTWPHTAYRRELSNQMARYAVLVDSAEEPVAAPPRRRSLLDLLRRGDPAPPTSDYIVGYVGVWLMVDEAHIVAIAVREGYRGRGLGELLLAEAIDLALANRQENVTLEVRRSNVVAQNLYEKYRFLKVGVRRRYYSDNGEDAIIMSTPPIQGDNYTEYLAYLRDQWERKHEGA
ncbi:MAG: ribosomal-protein-alanine N-acetyltransferase [Dehalococcoidia bacterium]|nr:ribosomal-protein-alanine N-acetyltransferase [Dehalococcoidia bacterium]